jgi:hypothetical protein
MKFVVEEVAFGEASVGVRQFSLPVPFHPTSLLIPVLILFLSERKLGECTETSKKSMLTDRRSLLKKTILYVA